MGIAGRLFRLQCRFLPHNRRFDRLIALQAFVYAHRRLPSSTRLLLNDVVHTEKVSKGLVDPLYAFTTDKEFVKDYIASQVGREYAVKTLAILRSEEEVFTHDYPARCCIKPTHSSGQAVFRLAGEELNLPTIASWLKVNHYERSREYQYKNLTPKILVEDLIDDPAKIRDYKVFCYEGEPTVIQVDLDRRSNHKRLYYDANFSSLPFTMVYPKSDENIEKPAQLNEMLGVARKLSWRFRFCRIDFYLTHRVFVGEITHHHESGYARFLPQEDEIAWSSVFFSSSSNSASNYLAD